MRVFKLSLIVILSVILVLSARISFVQAKQDFPKIRSCPRGQVWVQPHVKPNGKMAPGFCRPSNRRGFRWVPGRKGPDGKWRRGYWLPAGHPPPNKEWVHGHYDKKGKWVEGQYRLRRRPPPAGGVFGPRGPEKKGGPTPSPFSR